MSGVFLIVTQEPDWVQPLAGHTMTRGEGSKLIIIGGFSTSDYFNDIVYIYDANSYLISWDTKSFENRTRAKPAGKYHRYKIFLKVYCRRETKLVLV